MRNTESVDSELRQETGEDLGADFLDHLRREIPYCEFEPSGFFRYDTWDREDIKDQWLPYCELLEDIRNAGGEPYDAEYDHDTIWGKVRPVS